MEKNWSETEIQSLKAQEAKDLAVSLLHELRAKERDPITAGQVQLKELQYDIKIKEAEAEDNRCREAHELRIKELELQIAQERRQQAEQAENADRVRQQHSQLIEQVRAAQESLSIQLERATREYNARVESLEASFTDRKASLEKELDDLQRDRDSLREQITDLTDLSELAEDAALLRRDIESLRASQLREKAILEEQLEQARFERDKTIHQIQREQEAQIVDLKTQHRIQIIQLDMEAAKKILAESAMVPIASEELNEMRRRLEGERAHDEAAHAELQREAEDDLRKSYNITTSEVFDVTELYYREKSLSQETAALRDERTKLEAEIKRMRQHIENEPERIAKAVEAAKVSIQNNIEQASRGR